jgi:hypothetical protein
MDKSEALRRANYTYENQKIILSKLLKCTSYKWRAAANTEILLL